MKLGEKMEKVVDVICEILGTLTIAFMVFVFINRAFGFIKSETVKNILESILIIAVLLVLALVGLQFALKRGIFMLIIFALLVAAAVVFIFFPDVLPISQKAASNPEAKEAVKMLLRL